MRWNMMLATVAATVAAAPAQAATYCVARPDCPPEGIVQDDLAVAVQTAGASTDPDTVLVGPGTFPVAELYVGDGTRLEGSGMGRTILAAAAGSRPALAVHFESATVADLTLRLHEDGRSGVDADFGGLLERVEIDGRAMTGPGTGLGGGFEATFRQGRIRMPNGLGASVGALIEDSVIEAAVGVFEGDYTAHVRRSIIRAEVGIVANGRGIGVEDTAVHVGGAAPVGLRAEGRSSYAVPLLDARNVTVVGPGHGVGVDVTSWCDEEVGGAVLDQVAIAGFTVHLRNVSPDEPVGDECELRGADLSVHRSAFDPARLESSGEGRMTIDEASPVATDLGLIDPANGDLRPRWDSPLIDAGAAAAPFDLRGLPRVGAPDVGAYEYQFAAPLAVAAARRPFTFDASATTDVDGDPLTFAWTFDDGSTADGAVVEAPGRQSGTVVVTDVTGRSASATATMESEPPPPPPAPPPVAEEAVAGTPASEVLQAVRARVRPARIAIRARRRHTRGIGYRISGRVVLPAGEPARLCAGASVAVRVPARRGRTRVRRARVRAGCRFAATIRVPGRFRGRSVRLMAVLHGGPMLTNALAPRITLRPR